MYLGLDLETSGTSHAKHVPIQLGMALGAGESFHAYIDWQWAEPSAGEGGWPQWDERAARVHNIDKQRLKALGVHADVADNLAYEWLMKHTGESSARARLPVGWNISGFDLPFVRQEFPRLSWALSRQTVDLNAVVFALVRAGVRQQNGSPHTHKSLKKAVKRLGARRAVMIFDASENWHDAEWDAQASLGAFDVLTAIIGRLVVAEQNPTARKRPMTVSDSSLNVIYDAYIDD